MLAAVKRMWAEEEGQGLTEYGLILGLVAIVVIGLLITMGGELQNIFNDIISGLQGQEPQ